MIEPAPSEQPLRERVSPYRCGICNERFTDLNWSLPTEEITRCHKCKANNVLRIVVVYVRDSDRRAS